MAIENQKIKFLTGTQEKFDGLKTSQAGAFYLTSDTQRLYVGLDENNPPVPVNQGVIFIDSANDLPNDDTNKENYAGKFYFIKTTNILCVYSNGKWVQINSDTFVKSIAYSTAVAKNTSNQDVATVTLTLTHNDTDNVVSGGFKLVGKGNVNITKGDNNEIEFSVPAGDIFKIGAEVTAGTSYDVGGSAKVKLSGSNPDNDATNSDITIVAGENVKITAGSDSKSFKINAKDSTLTKVEGTNKAAGGFDISVTVGEDTVAGSIDPMIRIDDTDIHFVNGKADLSTNIYSKSEIDTKFNGLDAMRYKGTISNVNNNTIDIPSDAENGDTYKYVNQTEVKISASDANFESDSQGLTIRSGDVLIVKGDEATGVFKWTVIPSGDDVDTRYELAKSGTAHSIVLKEASSTNEQGEFGLKTTTPDQIELVDDDSSSTKRIVDIKHVQNGATVPAEATAVAMEGNASADEGASVDVYADQVVLDGAGHVTGLTRKKYTIKDTHNHLKKNEYDTTAASNVATIKNTITTSDGDDVISDSFKISSNNLTVTASTKEVNIDLEWGSF